MKWQLCIDHSSIPAASPLDLFTVIRSALKSASPLGLSPAAAPKPQDESSGDTRHIRERCWYLGTGTGLCRHDLWGISSSQVCCISPDSRPQTWQPSEQQAKRSFTPTPHLNLTCSGIICYLICAYMCISGRCSCNKKWKLSFELVAGSVSLASMFVLILLFIPISMFSNTTQYI